MWLCSSRKNLMDDWQKYVEVAFPLSAHTRHIGTMLHAFLWYHSPVAHNVLSLTNNHAYGKNFTT